MPSTFTATVLPYKSGKLAEHLDFCSKAYYLQFFIRNSMKNFLEGGTTTHADTKITACTGIYEWVYG